MDSQENQIQITYDHVLAEHYSCCLCGQELTFSYKTDEEKITEQSSCMSCGLKNKPKQFVLH